MPPRNPRAVVAKPVRAWGIKLPDGRLLGTGLGLRRCEVRTQYGDRVVRVEVREIPARKRKVKP